MQTIVNGTVNLLPYSPQLNIKVNYKKKAQCLDPLITSTPIHFRTNHYLFALEHHTHKNGLHLICISDVAPHSGFSQIDKIDNNANIGIRGFTA